MNTNLIASLLLSTLATTLCAQDMRLEAGHSARGFTAAVHDAPEGSLVLLVLGLNETTIRLPNGAMLGVEPVMLIGPAIASSAPTNFWMQLRDVDGLVFFVQGVALPAHAKSEARSIMVSDVAKVLGNGGPVGPSRNDEKR